MTSSMAPPPARLAPLRLVGILWTMDHSTWRRWMCGFATLWALVAVQSGASNDIPHPPSTVPSGYTLEWRDEFDAPISFDKWMVFPAQERESWARPSREAIGHDGSNLVLGAIQKDRDVLYGWVTTQPFYRRRYGYFEARLAAPAARGWRAAFWLMTPTPGQPPDRPDLAGSEVQIASLRMAEHADRAVSHAVYWNAPEGMPYLSTNRDGSVRIVSNAPPPAGTGTLVPLPNVRDRDSQFHIYGLLWTEREYVFYVDGRETWRIGRGVSHVPQFICLALLPDPRGRNRPMRVDTPARLLCDYVRVYAPPAALSSSGPNSPAIDPTNRVTSSGPP